MLQVMPWSKGGNAMDLVHRIGAHASVDLDFSMKDDFDQVKAQGKVEQAKEFRVTLRMLMREVIEYIGFCGLEARTEVAP